MDLESEDRKTAEEISRVRVNAETGVILLSELKNNDEDGVVVLEAPKPVAGGKMSCVVCKFPKAFDITAGWDDVKCGRGRTGLG